MLNVKTTVAKSGYFKQLDVTVEGALVSDWAAFLEREVDALRRKSLPIVIDVTRVEDLDETGIETLTRFVAGVKRLHGKPASG